MSYFLGCLVIVGGVVSVNTVVNKDVKVTISIRCFAIFLASSTKSRRTAVVSVVVFRVFVVVVVIVVVVDAAFEMR